jgi:hypothetical protein
MALRSAGAFLAESDRLEALLGMKDLLCATERARRSLRMSVHESSIA